MVFELRGYYRFYFGFVTFFECLFFLFFIRLNIKRKTVRMVIPWIALGFVVFHTIYTLKAKFTHIDSVPIGVETIIILFFSLYCLFEQINTEVMEPLYNNFRFWIILGMILYLAGSFFIYIFASQLPYEEIKRYWVFIDAFLIMKNILFFIGILIFGMQQRPPGSTPSRPRTLKTIP